MEGNPLVSDKFSLVENIIVNQNFQWEETIYIYINYLCQSLKSIYFIKIQFIFLIFS